MSVRTWCHIMWFLNDLSFKMNSWNMHWLGWKREGQREYSEEREETLNIAGADSMPSVSLSEPLQLLPKSPVESWQVCQSLWVERPAHSRPGETVQTHSSWPAPHRKLYAHHSCSHYSPAVTESGSERPGGRWGQICDPGPQNQS